MKHPSNRAFFAYWDDKRCGGAAPERSEIEPSEVRDLLADIFVLSYDADTYPFRVAGTRVCALLGRDLKGQGFAALFAPDSRSEVADILGIVAEDTLAVIAGIVAKTTRGDTVNLELLLLPFNTRPHTPLSLTGLLAPFGEPGAGTLGEFTLTSWRTIGQQPRRFTPRALRKWSVVQGLTVYEGLR
ncbi:MULTISPECIES: PAS domain-containing protein [Rhodopseudomonas]|uniref:PAS domain-containing protein n=1 Tax=Rhodopseudomonas palustris TaxID=1076 RepID=A0A0D7ERM2_RHOPL|nr:MULTISPECIES: PAS domain-containing protein [Rhodopseudomonas]KIZ42102.1 hypothetical protein OO17_13500 [Rhodopseudomonas palustris]MDF3814115.1 PAS domain-containing protein [Rhodopseudomonas sp. BAL398]WOK19621.1 PAS domain-containing protein [Rhodopseudomonas sp. BAL398]